MDGSTRISGIILFLTLPVSKCLKYLDYFSIYSSVFFSYAIGFIKGSKAAMKTISEADVVLALGSRLGPFGSLPQYGFDYWPKNAKIIQVL